MNLGDRYVSLGFPRRTRGRYLQQMQPSKEHIASLYPPELITSAIRITSHKTP